MPQRNVASNFTFEQQRVEINNLAQDFWSQKGTVDTALPTFLKHDGSNAFTGQTLSVPNAFTINSNSGNGTVTISGNLNVSGTTTTVNTTNLDVTDKNITIAKGNTSDATADGAGITIDSGTDITFNFVDAKDAWVSSIGLEATTYVKSTRAQFTGAGNPTTGQGLELTAPDQNTGQIASYDRDTPAYKELRLKGSTVSLYTGTTNALIGTFNSTGLTTTGDITLDSTDKKIYLSNDSDQYITANAANNYLVLGTANGERLRIDSSGNANFGSEKAVAFPSGTGIQVYHSANPRIKLTNDATGNLATDGTQIYLSSDGDTIIDNKDGEDIIFHTNAAEKFRIKNTTTGSFIGIGNDTSNSSIAATFQVIAADGEADELYVGKFHNLEATAGRSYGVDIRAGSNSTDHGFRVKNRANDTTQLLVRGDGNVGIGEDSPVDRLVVQEAKPSDDVGIRVKNDTTTDGDNTNPTTASLYLNTSTGDFNTFYIQARRNDNDTWFGYADPRATDHVPSMCITNDGNIGVGSTNPSQPLTLKRTSSGQSAFGLRFEYENTVGPTSTSAAVLCDASGLTFKNYNSSRHFIFETGNVYPSSNGTQNLGTGSNRWLDVYTENLNVTKPSGNLSTYITATSGLGTIEIAGSTGAFIDLKTPTSDDFDMRVGTSGTGGYINTDSNSNLSVNCPIIPDANGQYDLGGSGNRWANVYSADLQLSNKGSTNEVDGTWGDFTIQEGESDLFLINRRNGKKYKFNITEVS